MNKKKILIMCIIIILLIGLAIGVFYIINYNKYKKILFIIENAKAQLSSISNVKIECTTFKEKEKLGVDTIFIKDNIQCNTDNREFIEMNNGEYTILDLTKKEKYYVSSHDNDKKIYICSAENEELYIVELLPNITNYSLKDTFEISNDMINNMNCYKISIYNKNSDFYEINYWISKNSGLLLKKDINYFINKDKKCNEQYLYNYTIDTVNDYDVRRINLDDYNNYEIIDER